MNKIKIFNEQHKILGIITHYFVQVYFKIYSVKEVVIIKQIRKINTKKKTILRQSQKIKKLVKKIEELEDYLAQRDELSQPIDNVYSDLMELTNEFEEKCKEYDLLLCDLRKVKNIINRTNVKFPWYERIKNRIRK